MFSLHPLFYHRMRRRIAPLRCDVIVFENLRFRHPDENDGFFEMLHFWSVFSKASVLGEGKRRLLVDERPKSREKYGFSYENVHMWTSPKVLLVHPTTLLYMRAQIPNAHLITKKLVFCASNRIEWRCPRYSGNNTCFSVLRSLELVLPLGHIEISFSYPSFSQNSPPIIFKFPSNFPSEQCRINNGALGARAPGTLH